MTFPSHLIASIQFISASHARPQSIKHALLQRSSCPLITPIIKVQELWVRPSRLTAETNRFFNSPRQEANQSRPLSHQAWEKLGNMNSSTDLGISHLERVWSQPLYHEWSKTACVQLHSRYLLTFSRLSGELTGQGTQMHHFSSRRTDGSYTPSTFWPTGSSDTPDCVRVLFEIFVYFRTVVQATASFSPPFHRLSPERFIFEILSQDGAQQASLHLPEPDKHFLMSCPCSYRAPVITLQHFWSSPVFL